ncbi:MAG: DNA/RNA nuclease SfsA [Sphingomonadales bacterium]|jgi:sugar fermentation stimulation protein A
MKFESPLIPGRLIKRYKRFLADVELKDGETITAHCANPGSMMGLLPDGAPVWLSPNTNPKAKLPYRWELVEVDETLIGINTAHPNRIVEHAIQDGTIEELQGYKSLRREVKYGENSRVDLLLEDPNLCYVEVKNVTLKRGDAAQFPDSVTTRGAKHLRELGEMVREGYRAVMVFLVQRADCDYLSLAKDIDPAYAEAMELAKMEGVEVIAYWCTVTPQEIKVAGALPVRI